MSGNDGGQSLSGGPGEQLPEGWGQRSAPRVGRIGDWNGDGGSSARPSGGSRFGTLGSPPMPGGFGGSGQGRPGNDEDDDEEADEQPQSFFAGGERSGLSVEGPGRQREGNSTVRDILRKAALATQAQMGATPGGQPRSTAFTGSGNTLGSDEVESKLVPDPDAQPKEEGEEETAIRQITFWREGFSVEDGPLMRYDDPANARLLDEINSGHAPLSILNVRPGQPVELRVARRVDEDYVPSKSAASFAGAGNRLGAPVPSVAPAVSPPSSNDQPPEGTRIPITPSFEVDLSAPTTTVQLRLADGNRMAVRLNLTHTVNDLRNYINAHQRGFAARPYILQTTFPTRVLDNGNQTVKEAGLANAVVVHRWVD